MLPNNLLNTKVVDKYLVEETFNHLFEDEVIQYPGNDDEEELEYPSNECYEN